MRYDAYLERRRRGGPSAPLTHGHAGADAQRLSQSGLKSPVCRLPLQYAPRADSGGAPGQDRSQEAESSGDITCSTPRLQPHVGIQGTAEESTLSMSAESQWLRAMVAQLVRTLAEAGAQAERAALRAEDTATRVAANAAISEGVQATRMHEMAKMQHEVVMRVLGNVAVQQMVQSAGATQQLAEWASTAPVMAGAGGGRLHASSSPFIPEGPRPPPPGLGRVVQEGGASLEMGSHSERCCEDMDEGWVAEVEVPLLVGPDRAEVTFGAVSVGATYSAAEYDRTPACTPASIRAALAQAAEAAAESVAAAAAEIAAGRVQRLWRAWWARHTAGTTSAARGAGVEGALSGAAAPETPAHSQRSSAARRRRRRRRGRTHAVRQGGGGGSAASALAAV